MAHQLPLSTYHRIRHDAAILIVSGLILGGVAGCQQDGSSTTSQATAFQNIINEPLASEPWEFSGIPGVKITSAHYVVYTTIRSPVYQRLLLKVLEKDYDRFAKLVDIQPAPASAAAPATSGATRTAHAPLECYVFGDRPQWEFFTRKRMPQNSDTYLRIGAGGYAQEGVFVGYDLGRETTLSVIAHEAWHQYSWFAFKDKLPSFLEEGLATQNEAIEWTGTTPSYAPARNLQRYRSLREAIINKRLWTLDELARTHAGQAVQRQETVTAAYYAQVWSFTLFLKQSPVYRPKFLDMIKRAHEGRLHEALGNFRAASLQMFTENWNSVVGPAYLRAYINPDLAALEKEYRQFLSELVHEWPPKTANPEF